MIGSPVLVSVCEKDNSQFAILGSHLKFQDFTKFFESLSQRLIRLQSRRNTPHRVAYRRIPETTCSITRRSQAHPSVPAGNQHRQTAAGITVALTDIFPRFLPNFLNRGNDRRPVYWWLFQRSK